MPFMILLFFLFGAFFMWHIKSRLVHNENKVQDLDVNKKNDDAYNITDVNKKVDTEDFFWVPLPGAITRNGKLEWIVDRLSETDILIPLEMCHYKKMIVVNRIPYVFVDQVTLDRLYPAIETEKDEVRSDNVDNNDQKEFSADTPPLERGRGV